MSGDNQLYRFEVTEETEGQRLDVYLSALCPDFSRSRIKSLIVQEECRVDGVVSSSPSKKLKAGNVVVIEIPDPVEAKPEPQNIALDIVYEDDCLIVINKQAGLTVHPGAGQHDCTLVNALLYHCGDSLSGIGGVMRPGIVHRLDKDTTGLMVAAKNDVAHRGLSDQLADRSLSRIYNAFTWNAPMLPKGTVDMPIGRDLNHRTKMSVRTNKGKEAVTHYKIMQRYSDAISLVECKLESGRTHQIRVHMQHIGLPLVGDSVYGLDKTKRQSILRHGGYDEEKGAFIVDFPRQALHARSIGFVHPVSGEHMRFDSDLPADMLLIQEFLE